MTDKALPHDLTAEEAVLGSLLIDTDSYYKIASVLQPEDFYREKNSWIYQARQNIDVCDQVTMAHELAKTGKLEAVGGAAYLSHLVDQCPTSVHAEYYAGIVKQTSSARKLIKAGMQIQELGFEGRPDMFEAALKSMMVLKSKDDSAITPKKLADTMLDYYSGLIHGEIEFRYIGIPTFDKLGGLEPGEYMIIGGETEMGKTTLLNQIGKHQKGTVLYFSTEMIDIQMGRREMAQAMRTKIGDLGDIEYLKRHEVEIIDAVGKVAKINLHIVTGSITTNRIYSEVCRAENPRLFIVDYIQRLGGVKNTYESTSAASREIADIAKTTGIPVIVASQLKREDETKSGKKISFIDRLKDSGNIANDCDDALFIEREKGARPGDPKRLKATLYIEKHKQGGEHFQIPLKFVPSLQRYEEDSEVLTNAKTGSKLT